MPKKDKTDYTKTKKFIRDLVHGYVYITEFEREIIDTVEFQRLKDVRQLTCQHVYPAARHTRFEHSLGVLELTRQALKHLNSNGFIQQLNNSGESDEKDLPLRENLIFNGTLAALLHDVGHCPFSHLGETIFDEDEVNELLFEIVTGDNSGEYAHGSINAKYKELSHCFYGKMNNNAYAQDPQNGSLAFQFKNYSNNIKMIPGALHEKISCIVIMKKYFKKLNAVKDDDYGLDVDFELLFRCILGIEYDVTPNLYCDNYNAFTENQKKNVVVNLINSKVFDMDKLDYIMRDSYMTGIGTPLIDTKRLFRNMYLSKDYSLVFTNRAVPALQNMIEARDGLYMYVYNHHNVVYSDFMNYYIFRRMDHNARDYFDLFLPQSDMRTIRKQNYEENNCYSDYFGNICIVPKYTIFSLIAILENNRSDSDIISMLNMQYQSVKAKLVKPESGAVKSCIKDMIKADLSIENKYKIDNLSITDEKYDHIVNSVTHTHTLLNKYLSREFLKPWWKTNFEFNHFINKNFPDDKIRKELCRWICNKRGAVPDGAEFRSQLAKHVSFITNEIYNKRENYKDNNKVLNDGEFFVIERSTSFFAPDTIRRLDIALKKSEILGPPNETKYQTDTFYIKELTNIIPQRDYESFYSKNSFYIFSKKLGNQNNAADDYYQTLEKIFVFVATELVSQGEASFQAKFSAEKSIAQKNENDSKKKLCDKFLEISGN